MPDYFTPYIESPYQKPDTVVSGGMNISAVEHLLQGVSIKDQRKRAKGILPRLSSGDVNNNIEPNLNFGQSLERYNKFYYADKQFYSAYDLVNIGTLEIDSESETEYLEKDGVIEPFVIRDQVSFSSIESPFIARSFKGTLMDGNEDVYGASSIKQQFINIKNLNSFEAFEDSSEMFSPDDTGGNIALPGYIFEGRQTINPFDDKEYIRLKNYITNDSGINDVLFDMTGSVQDDFIPYNHKSSGAGIIYYNNDYGTDSIAFGGLTNKYSDLEVSSSLGYIVS